MSDEKFEIQRVSLLVCFLCNLKCRDCCVRAVTYKNGYNPSLAFIIAQIDKLFTIVDKINYFSVEGGEPLLFKNLSRVVEHIATYADKIGVEMPLITNGSLTLSEDLLNALEKLGNKAHVLIDNYGKDKSPKVEEIVSGLKARNIRNTVKDYSDKLYFGGWIDLWGKYEKKHTKEESRILYSKCAWAQKLQGVVEIIGGLLIFCPPSRIYNERGIDTRDGWMDMFDETTALEEKREIVRGWYKKDCFNACMYCNGIHDESERITPAIQLTPEEYKLVRVNEYRYREEI